MSTVNHMRFFSKCSSTWFWFVRIIFKLNKTWLVYFQSSFWTKPVLKWNFERYRHGISNWYFEVTLWLADDHSVDIWLAMNTIKLASVSKPAWANYKTPVNLSDKPCSLIGCIAMVRYCSGRGRHFITSYLKFQLRELTFSLSPLISSSKYVLVMSEFRIRDSSFAYS